jgi:3-methyladenine DNA glycosylase Mpg
MKIRIKSNSIRYRLTQSDVSHLVSTGYLEDSVEFGAQKLVYALKIVNNDTLATVFENNTITLLMPGAMIDALANTSRVGFENTAGALYMLVEKDFTCLDNVAEDQSDNYPNPLANKVL